MKMINILNRCKKENSIVQLMVLYLILSICVVSFPNIVKASWMTSDSKELIFEKDCWRLKNPDLLVAKLSDSEMLTLREACGSEEGFRAFKDSCNDLICPTDKPYSYFKDNGEVRIVGGVCYGLSVSTILNKNRTIDISSDLHSLNPKDYYSVIAFYHVTQNLPGVLNWRVRYNSMDIKDKINSIYYNSLNVKIGGSPLLIIFGEEAYEGHDGWGHAVVGYADEAADEPGEFSSSQTNRVYNHRIYIYDSNNVNDSSGDALFDNDHCLLFNVGTGEWEIPFYGVGSHNSHSYLEGGNCYQDDLNPYAQSAYEFNNTIIYLHGDRYIKVRSSNWSVCGNGNGLLDNPNNMVPLRMCSINSANSRELTLFAPSSDESVIVSSDDGTTDSLAVRVLMEGTYYNVECNNAEKIELNNDGTYSIYGNSGDFIVKSTVSSGDTFILTGTAKNAGDIDVSYSGSELRISGENVGGVEVSLLGSSGELKKQYSIEKGNNEGQNNSVANTQTDSQLSGDSQAGSGGQMNNNTKTDIDVHTSTGAQSSNDAPASDDSHISIGTQPNTDSSVITELQPSNDIQPIANTQTNINAQPSIESLANTEIQQGNCTQEGTDTQPTTEAQPVTPETVLESITISRVPSFVKVKVRKNKVTVSWKKIKKSKKTKALLAQIKNIQIQYSTDPTFNQNPVTKTIGKNKTEVVLKLKKKTTYYIRLRYVGKDGFSNWSKVKKVKMK